MALEGTLKEFGLADIFQLIFHQRKTGILTIRWDKKKATVSFEDGMIVSAESSERLGPDRIGEILLRAEKLTKEGLKDALNRQKNTEEKLGLILEDQGLITREDLQVALKLQIKETIFQLFRLKEGAYTFEQFNVIYDKDYLSPLSTEFVLMEGIRRIDEWPFIEKMIPGMDIIFEKNQDKKTEIPEEKKATEVLKEETDFDETESEGGLSKGEIKIYSLVDGKRDISTIVAISQMGDFDTCKALSNLLMSGYIKKVETMSEDADKRKKSIITTGMKEIRSKYGSLADALVLLSGIIILAVAMLTLSLEPIGSHLINGFIYPQITRNRIEKIKNIAAIYRLNNGSFPDSIRILVESGYLSEKEIKDSWGEEIILSTGNEKLTIFSKGEDRRKNTKDDIN